MPTFWYVKNIFYWSYNILTLNVKFLLSVSGKLSYIAALKYLSMFNYST